MAKYSLKELGLEEEEQQKGDEKKEVASLAVEPRKDFPADQVIRHAHIGSRRRGVLQRERRMVIP